MNKMFDRIIDIIFIAAIVAIAVGTLAYTIINLNICGHTFETDGMMLVSIVPILTAATMIPLLIDDYKENCKEAEEDQ